MIYLPTFQKIIWRHTHVTGYFEIKQEQMEFFQSFLKHKMDFNKYEYGFWGGH
ncbi:MAG: DUF7683 domain-containing protein [Bacillota bacterium]